MSDFLIKKQILKKYQGKDTRVTIPDGITEIGNDAFWNCEDIVQIIIPESVTKIDSYAFYKCKNLKTINLPKSIAYIGRSAFEKCEKLTSFIVPDGITKIEVSTFSKCKSLKTIIIPDNVTEICESAFEHCEKLTDIMLPIGIKKINENAFWGCEQLKKINLPDTISYIGRGAFALCYELTEISIPTSVTCIEAGAFEYCKKLKEILIPENAIITGDYVFKGCRAMSDRDGFVIVRNCLYDYVGNRDVIMIPESVTRIAEKIFESKDLKTIRYDIPDETVIEKYTFPDNVLVVCLNDNYSKLPIANKKLMIYDVLLHLDYYKENFKGDLKGLYKAASRLFNSVIDIACKDNPKEVLPILENYLSIGGKVKPEKAEELLEFAGKNKLTEVTAILLGYQDKPDNKKEKEKFESDKTDKALGLKEKSLADWRKIFTVGNISDGYIVSAYKAKDPVVEIPASINGKSVIAIGDSTFSVHYGSEPFIETVLIPDSIKSIGESAFLGCSKIENIKLPASLETIEKDAFCGCSALKSISIPANVRTIGNEAFYGCTSLSEIIVDGENKVFTVVNNCLIENKTGKLIFTCSGCVIPDGCVIKIIGRYAFAKHDMTEMVIPKGVKKIQVGAFCDCANLKSVVIPDGVTEISGDAFSATGIESITIPDSVTRLGRGAFWGCKQLKTVRMSGNVKEFPESLFSGCERLESINIPEGVTFFNNYVFSGCTSLKELNIPDSLENVGYHAFGKKENYSRDILKKMKKFGHEDFLFDD